MPSIPKDGKPPVERPAPARPEIERVLLGAVLLDPSRFSDLAAALTDGDFSLESHRRIFRRMGVIYDRADQIDAHIVAHELQIHSELESVGGLAYLNLLTDGLPEIPAFSGYIKLIKDAAALRKIIAVSAHAENLVYGGQSAHEIIGSFSDQLLDIQTGAAKEIDITPEGIISSYPGGIDQFMDPSKQEIGIPTGFTQFDDMTAGLQPGELIIIGARPRMGKTSIALNIAEHATIKLKKRVIVFSLEMSRVQNLRRMICSMARVDYQKFRMGILNAGEIKKCGTVRGWLVESHLLIDDNPMLTMASFRARMNKILKKYGVVDLAIVDYLQLMSSTGKQENRNQEVSAQSRGLKLASKEFNIPIVALSQLSRAVETRKGDHRPILSDLRESGSIEQDSDLVAFLHRPEVYDKTRDELKGKAELIIAKSRNGAEGTVDLAFLGPQMRFENLSHDTYDEHGE